MSHSIFDIVRRLGLVAAVMVLAGCASTDYLPVRYRLPDAAETLGGKTIALKVVDARGQASIFGPSMREDFRHFTGKFALTVAPGEGKGMVIGAFDLEGLFREALVQRLKRAGVTVVAGQTASVPQMTVTLTRFELRQESTKWFADIAYRAELARLETLTAAQNISGTEERFRIPGSKNIEKVLGDIFSTMINRLDVAKLFADASV